jgi:hypothetical protein
MTIRVRLDHRTSFRQERVMDTFISALAVAALGALTWLAWYESETYSKIHRFIQSVLFCVVSACFGYNISILQILYSPERLKGIDGEVLAKLIIEGLWPPIFILSVIALMMYLLFLWFLPHLRGAHRGEPSMEVGAKGQRDDTSEVVNTLPAPKKKKPPATKR